MDALKQELKNVMNRLSNLDQELLQRITDIQRKSPNYFGTSFRNPILSYHFFTLLQLSNFLSHLVTLIEGGQQKLQRLAVPASQVFPQFIKLAETWRGFQEETIILSRLDSLRRLLYDFTRCLAKLPYKRLAKKLGEEDEGRSAITDEERNESNSRGSINDEDFVADLISPGDVENYDDVILEFSGFCPVALVRYSYFNIIVS